MKGLNIKQQKLEKKYKDVLSYKDMIKSVSDFDEKLRQIREHTRNFDDDLKMFRDKDQKKIRDF
jgi:hypothetical protein